MRKRGRSNSADAPDRSEKDEATDEKMEDSAGTVGEYVSLYQQFRRISDVSAARLPRASRRGRGETYMNSRRALLDEEYADPDVRSFALSEVIRHFPVQDPTRRIVAWYRPSLDQQASHDLSQHSSSDSQTDSPRATSSQSWVRNFIREEDSHFVCILHVDPLHPNFRDHTTKINKSGGLSNVVRHFEGVCHKDHMKEFNDQINEMMLSNEAAAEIVLGNARRVADKRKRALLSTKDRRPEIKRVWLHLLSWFLVKGIGFNASSHPMFIKYHKLLKVPEPPRRTKMMTLLHHLHFHIFSYIESLVRDAMYVSITADTWTSDSMQKFVGVTLHFVRNWKLYSFVIAVIPLAQSHNWTNLTTAVAIRLNKLLPARAVLVCTVTDNGANFLKFALSLHSDLEIAEIDGMLDESSWDEQIADDFHESTATWRCCDHRAQLAVLSAIEESPGAKQLIDNVRDIVRYIRASPDRILKFKQMQERRISVQEATAPSSGDDNLAASSQASSSSSSASPAVESSPSLSSSSVSASSPSDPPISLLTPSEARRKRNEQYSHQKSALNLILDCPTRWLTVHSMIDRFVLLYKDILALAAVSDYFEEYHGNFVTFRQYKTLEALADVLKTVHDMVTIAEGEKYVTSAYLPCLYLLCMEALKPLPSPSRVTDEVEETEIVVFKTALRTQLEQRLGYLVAKPNLALAAAALHPAFCGLTFIPSALRDEVWKFIETEALEFNSISENDAAAPAMGIQRRSVTDILNENPLDRLKSDRERFQSAIPRVLDTLREELMHIDPSNAVNEQVSPGVRLRLALSKTYDPLVFWKGLVERKTSFGLVSFVAEIFFCVPATSASSERTFSGGKLNSSDCRSRLGAENSEELISCQQFLKQHSADGLDAVIEQIKLDVSSLEV